VTRALLPGTDHAGIATQNVVERMLAERGVTRHRPAARISKRSLLERKYGGLINEQERRLGCSLD
jgi:valyl-tRNA synthetase